MRSQYTFYKSFDDIIDDLTDTQLAKYIRTINDVQFLRVKIDDVKFEDALLNIVWKSQLHSIKKSIDGYLESQKNGKIKNPYLGIYEDTFIPSKGIENEIKQTQTPSEGILTPTQTPCQQEEVKEEEKDKGKEEGEVKEENAHTPFSFSEEIKNETKPEINPDLKNLIGNSSRSENKVSEIISYYRDNISSRNEDIQEQGSYNQIVIKNYDLDKMLIGLKNYARFLEVSKKTPCKLFFFIRDAIYNDYQIENVVTTGKNIAVVPVDLVGKRFVIKGESIEFENDGYNKVGKDWKVTNAKNVEEMVNLVRGVA